MISSAAQFASFGCLACFLELFWSRKYWPIIFLASFLGTFSHLSVLLSLTIQKKRRPSYAKSSFFLLVRIELYSRRKDAANTWKGSLYRHRGSLCAPFPQRQIRSPAMPSCLILIYFLKVLVVSFAYLLLLWFFHFKHLAFALPCLFSSFLYWP